VNTGSREPADVIAEVAGLAYVARDAR
jgi:hypothetical protein